MAQKIARAAFVACALVALAATVPLSADNPDHTKQVKETGSCSGCDLRGAKLNGLVATGGDLTNADFRGATLYMATLKDADLTGAHFGDADLSGAVLTGAKGANLEGAITDKRTTCPDGTQGPCAQ